MPVREVVLFLREEIYYHYFSLARRKRALLTMSGETPERATICVLNRDE